MRVITNLGPGNLEGGVRLRCSDPKEGNVRLDVPLQGQTVVSIKDLSIAPFSDHGLIQVIHMVDGTYLSNLRFFEDGSDLVRQLQPINQPENETRILIDLVSGEAQFYKINLGPNVKGRIILKPRINEWAREYLNPSRDTFTSHAEGFDCFHSWDEDLGGDTEIGSTFLIDTEMRKMLAVRISVQPPRGLVLQRVYVPTS